MDKVYGLYNKNSSETFHFKEYFDEFDTWTNLSRTVELKETEGEAAAILDLMQTRITPENFAALAEYCSVENLTVSGEVKPLTESGFTKRKDTYVKTTIPEITNLNTLHELKEQLKMSMQSRVRLLKYRGEIFIQSDQEQLACPTIEAGKETLVYIRLYAPYTHLSRTQFVTAPTKLSMSHVIIMLGSQTLDQFRDKISCISDSLVCTDVSDNPNQEIKQKATDTYKSGFFFIENTFYNDFRDPNNLDYSKTVRDWAKTRNLGPFNSLAMEGVRIDSLSVRFGFPWVYQHQGSCEHLFVFMDARLVEPSDNLIVSNYPKIERVKTRPTKYCMMCGIFAARWVTTNNDRLPHDPCFFCDKCFYSYNYVDKKKIGNFKVYPYPVNVNSSDL